MDKEKTFQDFLTSQVPQISLVDFVISLFLAALCSFLLKKVFEKYSHVQTNKVLAGNNLVLITMTTMLIISVVKSSLALSLGLVGALSIVRFRTAIKEPEELVYLFVAIAMGLGMGADQRAITILGFTIIVGVIILLSSRKFKMNEGKVFHLILFQKGGSKIDIEEVKKEMGDFSESFTVKRWELSGQGQEVSSTVLLKDGHINVLISKLQQKFPEMRIKLFEPLDIG